MRPTILSCFKASFIAPLSIICTMIFVSVSVGQEQKPPTAQTSRPEKPPTYKTTPSGLKIFEEKVGSGDEAVLGKVVTVRYEVAPLINYNIHFTGNPSEHRFQLGIGAINKGLDEGIVGMRVGGKRVLFLPPSLSDRKDEAGYDIELLKVEQASSTPLLDQPTQSSFSGIFEGDGLVFQCEEPVNRQYYGHMLFSYGSPSAYVGEDLFDFEAVVKDNKMVGNISQRGNRASFTASLNEGVLTIETFDLYKAHRTYKLENQVGLKYDTTLFDPSVNKLPANYLGHDLISLQSVMSKAQAKDEFETSAAYNDRIMKMTSFTGTKTASSCFVAVVDLNSDGQNMIQTPKL